MTSRPGSATVPGEAGCWLTQDAGEQTVKRSGDSRGSLCKHHQPVYNQCKYSVFLVSALELCLHEVPSCS